MKQHKDLTKGSVTKGILAVALPTIGLSLMHMLYNLTDLFWLGRVDAIGLSSSAIVAGVGTAGFFLWLGDGFALLARLGTSIRVSQRAGAKDAENVRVYANNGLILALVLGLFYGLIMVSFARPIISIFKIEDPNVVNAAVQYLRIVAFFMVFSFMVNTFSGIYNGLGRAKTAFFIVSVGLVLNIVLDPIFILHFQMAEQGAAIATVLSQGIVFLIYLYWLRSKHRLFTFKLRDLSILKLKDIARLSLPTAIHSMLFTTISIGVGIFVASFGKDAIAAISVGSQIESMTWMVGGGISVAVSAFMGQNYGAKQSERIKQGYIAALRLIIPYAFLVMGLMYFLSEFIFSIFLRDPGALQAGTTYLKIIAISQVFMLVEDATAGAFNGLGETKIPAVISVLGNALRIPILIGLAYGLNLGVIGIWWALTISCIIKGSLQVFVYQIYQRKMQIS